MNIRVIDPSDAEKMVMLNRALDNESTFMLFEPNERNDDITGQLNKIETALNSDNITWLVAEDQNGVIQGHCVIARQPMRRIKHVGHLIIGMTRPYWGKGIGTALITATINMSTKQGISRIELIVRSDNQAAISLYHKTGFVEEGERTKSFFTNNTFYNELYMAKHI